ncbi:MAG: hypothetical protein IJS52_07075 [Bacilli bacterium]|nr:hypothetical protein [Bacilli bacterium]
MITKKYLKDFVQGFERCKDLDFEWNAKLFEKTGDESWRNILIERSQELRRSFEVNEANISSLKEALSRPLSDREYRNVADAALRMYQDGYDDICVFAMMLEPCIEYFISIHDLNYVIPLIHAYSFEVEQADIESIEKPKYLYEDILVYKDEYKTISSRYARLCMFKSYSNIISRILNNEEKGSFTRMYHLYQEALAIWNSPEAQEMDGKDEEFQYFIDRMLLTVTLYENVSVLTEEERAIYDELIEKSKSEDVELDSMVNCIDQVLHNIEGKVSDEETVGYLLSYFDDVFAHLDVHADPNEQEDYIDNCYNIIGTLTTYLSGDHAVPSRREDVIERMRQLRQFVKSLPYSFFNSEMNRYVYMLYQKIRPFMTFEEKKDYLLEVVMFRQPITCIHSLMVEDIAKTIAEHVLAKRPELFVGILEAKNVEEVRQKEKDILQYVCDCALFHDVGKVTLVDVINTQNRRLTEVEFKKIKTHPENGLKFLDNDPDFKGFYDVMIGHHRWYDGSAGYPANYDNRTSSTRIITDIVTIADCTDAATDILGRNYAKGKTFRHVLEEFIAGAGTRYNPDIVACMKEDENLIEALSKQTTDGRMDVYREVYSRYIQ